MSVISVSIPVFFLGCFLESAMMVFPDYEKQRILYSRCSMKSYAEIVHCLTEEGHRATKLVSWSSSDNTKKQQRFLANQGAAKPRRWWTSPLLLCLIYNTDGTYIRTFTSLVALPMCFIVCHCIRIRTRVRIHCVVTLFFHALYIPPTHPNCIPPCLFFAEFNFMS